jgi:hypothetical protein
MDGFRRQLLSRTRDRRRRVSQSDSDLEQQWVVLGTDDAGL